MVGRAARLAWSLRLPSNGNSSTNSPPIDSHVSNNIDVIDLLTMDHRIQQRLELERWQQWPEKGQIETSSLENRRLKLGWLETCWVKECVGLILNQTIKVFKESEQGFSEKGKGKMVFGKKDDFLSRGKTVQAFCSSLRISSAAASTLATLAERIHHEDQEISRQGSEELKPERPLCRAFHFASSSTSTSTSLHFQGTTHHGLKS